MNALSLTLIRIAKRPDYTIGKLYVDGSYFCDTLEPRWRDLKKERKVYGKTAIPEGLYRVTLDVVSQAFGGMDFYRRYADGGRLPRLLDVPMFRGVLIHVGNYPRDTKACILVGKNREVGAVLDSKETFKRLYKVLKGHSEITIRIR